MKKLLYIAPNPIEMKVANSITSKIIAQTSAFSEKFDTYLIGYGEKGVSIFHDNKISGIYERKNDRFSLYHCVREYVKNKKIDYFYIRYGYSELLFLKLLSAIKKANPSSLIIVEIPTFPYDQEMNAKGIKYRIFNVLDRMTRKSLKKYVDYFSTFSEDDFIFSVPSFHIINGIDFSKIEPKKPVYHKDNEINLIAVSAMGFNHAYERVIEGLNVYYQNDGAMNILFHMVGEGKELKKYRELVNKYHLQSHVVFYGYLKDKELDEVYNRADIAIASLGMHRANIYLASTLKTREYGAKGLPIVTSCKIDCYEEDWEYLLNVPADETSISIQGIIDFYYYVYGNGSDVQTKIRSYAENVCDIHSTMKTVIELFEKVVVYNEN